MNRANAPVWKETCLRVDEAARLIENNGRGTEDFVWEARDKWAVAARRWLEGTGAISDAVEAAGNFALAVEAAIGRDGRED